MPDPADRDRSRTARFATPLLFWCVGSLLMFYPMLLSGFDRTVGTPGDPRLVTYLLEHTFRWLRRDALHASLWDPPFYFPATNVFALSDALLGIAPLYWVWRVLGAGPESAYQGYLLLAASITYIATYALFRDGLGRGGVPAAAGALLFAFGAPRTAQVFHSQLLAHFYTPLALLALTRLFRADRPSPGWSAVLVACFLLQLWAAFYLAWLLGFALLVAAAIAATRAHGRAALRRTIAANGAFLIGFAAVAGVLLVPLARHYLDAAALVGFRDWATEVAPGMPVPQSWIFVGPQNLFYGRLMDSAWFTAARTPEGSLGVGLVTTAIAIAGLWWARRERAAALIALTAAVLVVLATVWPPGWSAWRLVHEIVPGAAAIRAVARIGLLVLLALALGFATAVERLRARSAVAGILVIGLPILEQLQFVPSFDKQATIRVGVEIAARVGPGCGSFYYAAVAPDTLRPLPYRPWKYHLDGMSAQLHGRVPTMNGYSGWMPPAWRPLYDNIIASPADTAAVRARLAAWAPAAASACIVTTPADAFDSTAGE